MQVVATLKDVALRAGVSIKTVSNVVNDQPNVAPATRVRVLAAIGEMKYRPNLPARHLRKGNVGVLALAVPDLSNPYFSDVGNAIVVAAASHSYTVLLDHTGGKRASEVLVADGLRPHLIDGVILSPMALEMNDLRADHVGAPIVLLGERLIGAPWDHVVIDNVAAARTATSHLLNIGRRRIAAIGVHRNLEGETSRLRLQGFSEALSEAGLKGNPQLLVPAPGFRRADGAQAHRSDGAHAMRRLLMLDDPPDAVFCFNDLLALGAMRALHEEGYRVPEDVAVIGFDDLEEAAFAVPSLSTISPSKEEIGQLAVSLLIDRIQGSRTGPPERIAPSFRLIVRESTMASLSTPGSMRKSTG